MQMDKKDDEVDFKRCKRPFQIPPKRWENVFVANFNASADENEIDVVLKRGFITTETSLGSFFTGRMSLTRTVSYPKRKENAISEIEPEVSSLTKMTKFPTSPLKILVLTFATVLGCGVMPPGQARARNFNVTGFTLPVNMAYSTDASVRMKAFGMAASGGEVQALVSRLVMQTVFDVLEQQGRNALLPDAIISTILGQLAVNITYEPLECKDVEKDPTTAMYCSSNNVADLPVSLSMYIVSDSEDALSIRQKLSRCMRK
ncbi:hypothetical protein KIN20_003220 [Parelaphostrongylus tenuis]|uniref:Uncharacterized protein n=1 Tax=Parelaphostrongylus tenuis TaxID=148309 RepID=A0AAD5QE60_PARTN|nr:hypothetical protein KIN20_003220 [Parelaphostrongylus tenuis]